jgi:hypothetical protein
MIVRVSRHRGTIYGANYKTVCPDFSFDCEEKSFDDYLSHRKTHNQSSDNNPPAERDGNYKVIY